MGMIVPETAGQGAAMCQMSSYDCNVHGHYFFILHAYITARPGSRTVTLPVLSPKVVCAIVTNMVTSSDHVVGGACALQI